MNISNAQLTDFSNGVLRSQADRLAKADMLITGIVAEYNQKNLGTVINDAKAENLIADGSETDGRTRVTGGDVFNFITLLNDLKGFFDTNNRRDVLAKWQVNAYRN